MVKIHDVVRIKDLPLKEDEWNGALALAISDEYIHPKFYKSVVKIKIADTLWAIETANVEVVSDSEKDSFIRTLEGNQMVEWNQCYWHPKKGIPYDKK